MQWTKFLCIGYYDGEHFWWFKDINEFLDTCRDEKIPTVYFHFGGKFDFMFLYQTIIPRMIKKRDVRIKNMIPRGSGILCFDLEFITKKEIITVSFRDSSALLPFSLKSICESFQVEHSKLEWDHEKTTGITNDLIKYLQMDCISLHEALTKYRNWELIKKSGPAHTMAGQAMKVFRTFLKQEIPSLPQRVDGFVRQSYFGGRTEIFKPLYINPDIEDPENTDEIELIFKTPPNEKLFCYDVNSLYPFIMKTCRFPTAFRYTTRVYEPNKMGFYEATVEVPKNMHIPPLPVVHKMKLSNKLIFPTGRFSGVWSTAELEYAKTLGVKIISTGKGMIFKDGGFIFKDYIEKLYEMRLKAKEKNDSVTDILTKLLMNSLYGRFGLNINRENLVFDDGQTGVTLHSEIQIEGAFIRLMNQKVVLQNTFTNVAIAAWVTSNARIHLHRILNKDPHNVYYCDTDSIFTTNNLPTGKELGDLKKESESVMACFLLPKSYFLKSWNKGEFSYKDKKGKNQKSNDKIVMKGFDSRKIRQFKFEDYMMALEGDMRRLKVLHDEKFATFKTAIKKDTFLALLKPAWKSIKSRYDKRLVYKHKGEYRTKPIHITQTIENTKKSRKNLKMAKHQKA